MRITAQRRGFTLIEFSLVTVIFAVVTTMLFVIVVTVMRIEETDLALHQRAVDHANTGDQFRSDVSQAVSTPRSWRDFQAAPHCLILQHDNDTHIVYQWQEQKLTRLEIRAGTTLFRQMAGSDRAEFFRPDPRLCVLQLTAEGGMSERFPSEIVAALAGERR